METPLRFRGTLMRRRILAVVLAFSTFSGLAVFYVFFIKPPSRVISPGEFIRTGASSIATLIASMASLLGVVDKRRDSAGLQTRLAPSFKSGLYGGVIGGALSGFIIGIVYYIDSRDNGVNWQRIPIVFAYGSAAGTLFGASIETGILVFSRSSRFMRLILNEVTGGLLGGAIGGVLAGALGGPLFFSMSGPLVSLPLLFGGSAVGGACVVLGILLYDYGGRWRDIVPSLIVSAVIISFPIGVGYFVLTHLNTKPVPAAPVSPVVAMLLARPVLAMLLVGAILGVGVGAILGTEVGLTLRLYCSMQAHNDAVLSDIPTV
jgi:hypothetical protein